VASGVQKVQCQAAVDAAAEKDGYIERGSVRFTPARVSK